MALFTTTLDLYGGVLRSGELQGFIIHETMPNYTGSRSEDLFEPLLAVA
jgi:hypothetical protein